MDCELSPSDAVIATLTQEVDSLKMALGKLTVLVQRLVADRDRLQAELDATHSLERDLEDAIAERDGLQAEIVNRVNLACEDQIEIKRLRAALEFYANRTNWYYEGPDLCVEWTGEDAPWDIARRALKEGK